MPKYPGTNSISKLGIAYVFRTIVTSNCIFNEIHQENDIGIDAQIEFVKDTVPLAKTIAVQIKSGASYFDESTKECKIPIGNHRDYWMKYPLPVYGIVYVPELDRAFWTNIKDYLKLNPGASTIRFPANRLNAFTDSNFKKIILPQFAGTHPELTYDETLDFFLSPDWEEFSFGLSVLFYRYSDRFDVWDKMIDVFKNRSFGEIPSRLIYYMAHIPWHGDIWGGRDQITTESREYARTLIASFDKPHIEKLLGFIGEEGVGRGTIGQFVEALISCNPNADTYLAEIARNCDVPLTVREFASIIFAYRNQNTPEDLNSSMKLLEEIAEESEYCSLILSHMAEYGGLNLY